DRVWRLAAGNRFHSSNVHTNCDADVWRAIEPCARAVFVDGHVSLVLPWGDSMVWRFGCVRTSGWNSDALGKGRTEHYADCRATGAAGIAVRNCSGNVHPGDYDGCPAPLRNRNGRLVAAT